MRWLLLLLAAPAWAGTVVGTVRAASDDAVEPGLAVLLMRTVELGGRTFPEPWVPEAIGFDAQVVGRARTDEAGDFRFDALRPGRYLLRLEAPGEADTPLEVPSDDAVVTVRLRPDLGTVIRGTVRGPDGRPLPDFYVFAAGIEDATGRNLLQGRGGGAAVRSDDQGRFVLLQAGEGVTWLQAGLGSFGYSAPTRLPLVHGQRVDGLTLVVPDERGALRDARGGGGILGFSFSHDGLAPALESVVDGFPAQQAGLRPGDRIVEVEGRSTTHMTRREFLGRVGGPPGSDVQIVWERDGQRQAQRLTRRARE